MLNVRLSARYQVLVWASLAGGVACSNAKPSSAGDANSSTSSSFTSAASSPGSGNGAAPPPAETSSVSSGVLGNTTTNHAPDPQTSAAELSTTAASANGTSAAGSSVGDQPTSWPTGSNGGTSSTEGGTGQDGVVPTEDDSTHGSVFPAGVLKPKLMIVGDSISAGPGCYKKFLDEKLRDNGITNYEFVGKYTDDCGGGIKHSAVSCSTTSDYIKDTFVLSNTSCSRDTFDGMTKLVAAFSPDLIMLQLGVNDVWNANSQIQPVLDNYGMLIEQARAHNPNIVVMVAQIHKINTQQASSPCGATDFSAQAKQLVDAVPGWVATVTSANSPVLVADLWSNSMVAETNDCVHPSDDAGSRRMADNWYAALETVLK